MSPLPGSSDHVRTRVPDEVNVRAETHFAVPPAGIDNELFAATNSDSCVVHDHPGCPLCSVMELLANLEIRAVIGPVVATVLLFLMDAVTHTGSPL